MYMWSSDQVRQGRFTLSASPWRDVTCVGEGVDQFMKRMGALYEIVIYTASLSKYADPLLDKLDIHKVMPRREGLPSPAGWKESWMRKWTLWHVSPFSTCLQVIDARLFRESCVFFEGHYVKDLSLLNRDVSQCIIVDNSPMSYSFHPGMTSTHDAVLLFAVMVHARCVWRLIFCGILLSEYAIDCGTFIDSPKDVEMWQVGWETSEVSLSDSGQCVWWMFCLQIADFLEDLNKYDDVKGRTRCVMWMYCVCSTRRKPYSLCW